MVTSRFILAFCKVGQKLPGVEFGSTSIMSSFKDSIIESAHHKEISLISNFDRNNIGYKKLNKAVKESINITNNRTFIIGGDHSISSASVPAFFDKYKENGHLLWIDAHADIHTKETSISGNNHGMPLSEIFGLMENKVLNVYKPTFNQLTYLGIRDIDNDESIIIKNNDINCITSYDINSNPINVSELLINKLSGKKLYISLDVDSLDPKFIPCTGTKVDEGINIDSLCKIVYEINKQCDIVCSDIVEFNPQLGEQSDVDISIKNILKYIKSIL